MQAGLTKIGALEVDSTSKKRYLTNFDVPEWWMHNESTVQTCILCIIPNLGLQVLGCVHPDSQFYAHQCKPGEIQNLSGKTFRKLDHQSSQHAKYSFACQTSTPSTKLHLKRMFLCFENNLCTGSWIFLCNFLICCLSLEAHWNDHERYRKQVRISSLNEPQNSR